MSSDNELLQLAQDVVSRAKAGEQVEAYVSRSTETDVRAYQGEIENLTTASSSGIGIRVVLDAGSDEGARLGFAWSGSLDPNLLNETLEAARDNAQFATRDPFVALAEPDAQAVSVIDVWDDELASIDTDRKVALAIETERAARAATGIRQAEANYGDVLSEMALVSTTGILATSRRTSSYCSVEVIAGEGAQSQSASGVSAGRGFSNVDAQSALGDALLRARRMVGATKGPTGRMTVVFDPRVTSTIISALSTALSGDALVRGRSFFAGRDGESVAVESFTLVDDPTDLRAFGAASYDSEGLACRRNALIENGTLAGFFFDSDAARRYGTTSTGSAVRGGFAGTPGAGCRALSVTPGELDQAAILAAVGDGLYVQSISGVHSGVNPVSGDFSVGAEGLLITDGALGAPVRELTVASTLQKMLQSIVFIGADLDWLPGVASGQTLAIADMQLSGT